jgi:hypothetical protein
MEARYNTNIMDAGLIAGVVAIQALEWAEQGHIDAVRDAVGSVWVDPASVEHVLDRLSAAPAFAPLAPAAAISPSPAPPMPALADAMKRIASGVPQATIVYETIDGADYCSRAQHEAEVARKVAQERQIYRANLAELQHTVEDQAQRLREKIAQQGEQHRHEMDALRDRHRIEQDREREQHRHEVEALRDRHRIEQDREREQHRHEMEVHGKRRDLMVEVETQRAILRVERADMQLADAIKARSEAEARAARAEAALMERQEQWSMERARHIEHTAQLTVKAKTAGHRSERLEEIESVQQLVKMAADAPESQKPMIAAAVAQQLGLPPATTFDRVMEAVSANPEAVGDMLGKVVTVIGQKLGLEEKNPPAAATTQTVFYGGLPDPPRGKRI